MEKYEQLVFMKRAQLLPSNPHCYWYHYHYYGYFRVFMAKVLC